MMSSQPNNAFNIMNNLANLRNSVTVFWIPLIVIAFLSMSVVGTGQASAESRLAVSPIDEIESAYQTGEISLDEKALLSVRAIKEPESLPDRFLSPTASAGEPTIHAKCATDVLVEVMVQDWPLLSVSTQQQLTELLARPSGTYTFVAPSGFFTLHYNLIGVDAVSSVDTDSDGTPDYVEQVAAYCDTSLVVHRHLGYRDPPPDGSLGGDNTYDVYFENMDYYGYAAPDAYGPEPWNDYVSYLVMRNNYIGFPPNNDPEGDEAGAAKATAAHEFHHAVQFAYDGGEPSWFMELDATHMEDIVFDHVDDNYNYLPGLFNNPTIGLMNSVASPYNRFPWALYLNQVYDSTLLEAVWDGARYQDINDALQDTLWARYGVTEDEAFADYATWNYITDFRDDGLHHTEGGSYPDVKLAAYHSAYPVSDRAVPNFPEGYAATYVEFYPAVSQGPNDRLLVNINAADGIPWQAFAIKSSTIDQHTVEPIALDPSTGNGTASIENFGGLWSTAIVVVNLNEFGGAASVRYSADVQFGYSHTSSLETVPLNVYSGTPREFSFWVKNTSQIQDIIVVTYEDTAGWVIPDTVSHLVQPGDSAEVPISVLAPLGTDLNSFTSLQVHVESDYEPDVFSDTSFDLSTVLQRGDANFDGQRELLDVLAIAAYAFLGGAPPVPDVDAGDFNCDETVELGDVLNLANYLYFDGPDSPCKLF